MLTAIFTSSSIRMSLSPLARPPPPGPHEAGPPPPPPLPPPPGAGGRGETLLGLDMALRRSSLRVGAARPAASGQWQRRREPVGPRPTDRSAGRQRRGRWTGELRSRQPWKRKRRHRESPGKPGARAWWRHRRRAARDPRTPGRWLGGCRVRECGPRRGGAVLAPLRLWFLI